MKHLFRQSARGRSDYAALTVFFLAYLAAMALVIAPGTIKSFLDAPHVGHMDQTTP